MCGDQAWLLERNQIYQERRDVVVDALRRLGLAVFEPQAAIYVWSATPAGWSAMDFAASVLEQVHVSLTPGTVFGAAGEGFVRLAITTPTPKLIEAMQRLTTWRE
jgi:LL-diaminopimelate aminotransferase